MATCEKCGGDSHVKDSRVRGGHIHRRRGCAGCGNRWSTVELDVREFEKIKATKIQARMLADRITNLLLGEDHG